MWRPGREDIGPEQRHRLTWMIRELPRGAFTTETAPLAPPSHPPRRRGWVRGRVRRTVASSEIERAILVMRLAVAPEPIGPADGRPAAGAEGVRRALPGGGRRRIRATPGGRRAVWLRRGAGWPRLHRGRRRTCPRPAPATRFPPTGRARRREDHR